MRALILTALVLAGAAGVWWLVRSPEPEAPAAPAEAPPDTGVPGARPAVAPPGEGAAAAPAGQPPFRERLRAFLATAADLAEADRDAAAEALRRHTLAREAEGSLLPAESAYIQLALLRTTIADEAQLRQRSEALLARYETASQAGWEAYRRQSNPRHEAYREAEADLIRRAREEGVSNEELRERLQALREDHYDEPDL